MAKWERNERHPGVKVYIPDKSFTYVVRFKQYGKNKLKGLGISDANIAESYACVIYDILQGKNVELGNLPSGVNKETVSRILDLNASREERVRAKFAPIFKAKELLDIKKKEKGGIVDEAAHLIFDLKKQLDNANLTIQTLNDELSEVKKDRDQFKAIAVTTGKLKIGKVESKPYAQAVEDFLNELNKENGTKLTYKATLKGLQEYVGADTPILDINPDKVKAYLDAKKAANTKVGTLRKYSFIIGSFLKERSSGLYPVDFLQTWREKYLGNDGKTEDDFYWLTPEKAYELIENISNPYWRNAALMQFELALRPLELTVLQSKNVNLDRKQLYIAPLMDGKETIRRLKTKRSCATMPLSAKAIKACRERMHENILLLFPKTTESGLDKITWHKSTNAFVKKHGVWNAKEFCNRYLEQLKEAAKKTKGVDENKLDGRTLRRSRGREIVIAQGMSKAAAFLRDLENTVFQFYARFQAKDVKV